MQLIAHRGFAAEHPENTLAAFRAAGEVADAVEFDVRRCGSGDLVVVHDETVDRVTDATGAVADFTAAELGALDVLGSGEGVPTLRDALDAVPPDVGVNAELKEPETAADAAAVLADAPHDVLVSSFHADALAGVREVARDARSASDGASDEAASSDLPVALLLRGDPDAGLRRALALDCAAVNPEVGLCLGTRLVARAHDAGLDVNAWTVRDRATAAALRRAGVDGLIADRSDLRPTRTTEPPNTPRDESRDVRVRDATPADSEAVREVHRESIAGFGPAAYDDEQVAAWRRGVESADYAAVVDDDEFEFVVAAVDGDVVAFGSLRRTAPDGYEAAVDAEVTAVYVHPSAAGEGVGSAVLAELERRAREAGAGTLGLTSSLNAVGFYERHGYERVRERTHEFSSGASTGVEGRVVVMVKEL